MKNSIKVGLAVLVLAAGFSSAMAARRVQVTNDPWVQPLHLDSSAAPATQYFQEMQRDGH